MAVFFCHKYYLNEVLTSDFCAPGHMDTYMVLNSFSHCLRHKLARPKLFTIYVHCIMYNLVISPMAFCAYHSATKFGIPHQVSF